MAGTKSEQKPRHAILRSHRCLHSLFMPTHLTLGSISDNGESRHATWRSRRSRKARYSPVPHIITSGTPSDPFLNGRKVHLPAPELNGMAVTLRVQTQKKTKPHLILDVTFWLAVTFTFGSAIWVVNGESVYEKRLRTKQIQASWSGSRY
jgi:hypothetical protein